MHISHCLFLCWFWRDNTKNVNYFIIFIMPGIIWTYKWVHACYIFRNITFLKCRASDWTYECNVHTAIALHSMFFANCRARAWTYACKLWNGYLVIDQLNPEVINLVILEAFQKTDDWGGNLTFKRRSISITTLLTSHPDSCHTSCNSISSCPFFSGI